MFTAYSVVGPNSCRYPAHEFVQRMHDSINMVGTLIIRYPARSHCRLPLFCQYYSYPCQSRPPPFRSLTNRSSYSLSIPQPKSRSHSCNITPFHVFVFSMSSMIPPTYLAIRIAALRHCRIRCTSSLTSQRCASTTTLPVCSSMNPRHDPNHMFPELNPVPSQRSDDFDDKRHTETH